MARTGRSIIVKSGLALGKQVTDMIRHSQFNVPLNNNEKVNIFFTKIITPLPCLERSSL
jgi:hypothetical protein